MKLCTYVYIHISLNVLGTKANNTENLYSNLYTLQRRSKKKIKIERAQNSSLKNIYQCPIQILNNYKSR